MRRTERYQAVLSYFERQTPPGAAGWETELHYGSSFELLVAVVLSAQCTDKRINQVTPALFSVLPTPAAMAEAGEDEIFPLISSVSYPRSKARHLAGLARMLCERFGGEVPGSREELMQLPGVGRKTANVVLAIAFGRPALAVDTHVARVSHRLGLVPARCATPLSIETELLRSIPERLVSAAHYWLLLHGRYTCTARSPHCDRCPFYDWCPAAQQ